MKPTIPIQVTARYTTEQEYLYSPEYLLVLPLCDGVVLRDVKDTPVSQGTLLFLSPFSERKLFLGANTKVLYAIIRADFLEPMLGPPKKAAIILQPDGTNTAKEKLIELFDLQYNVRSATNLMQMQVSMELLCALEPAISVEQMEHKVPAENNTRAGQIISYLDAHFREAIQLSDLAASFSASRQYISTILHKELGITFSEYLVRLRLEEAVRLLLTTDKSITEIAESSGFPNLKSFNQAFRAKYQTTPKDYRKSKAVPIAPVPTNNVLSDINQLLRPYRLVYKKTEEAVRITESADSQRQEPMLQRWDILNIDNCYECLQTDIQDNLAQIQKELSFRYVRLINILCHEMMPFIPSLQKHRFTNFNRLIDFFRKIGLTPMLCFGESYEVMPDAVMVSEDGYSRSLPEWLELLRELLDFSISRWGEQWVSTWRFEFCMPETLYGQENHEAFMELFDRSAALIRQRLPGAAIGGPALSLSRENAGRWNAWFQGIGRMGLEPDFISMELWADHTYHTDKFQGQHFEWKKIHTMGELENADAALAIQKVQSVKRLMAQFGYEDKKLFVSAMGITKYEATSAQVGGHCAAYLTKCILELNELVDGIGCWKAINTEAEYLDEHMTFSTGCGLLSRYRLKNINYYAFSFLTGLLPYKLFQGLHTIVTTDQKGNYAVLIHNCKTYSEYFYRHYTDEKGLKFDDPRNYTSNVALEQTISIRNVIPQEYVIRQFLIGDHHGCIASVLLQMGRVRILDESEIEYVAGQSLPYQHAFTVVSQEELNLSVTLQPNEVMLLRISPENGICYF